MVTDVCHLVYYSPVELIVVVMSLPPEVEPDQQQTEGKEEDEGPQQLPLHIHIQINIISSVKIFHLNRQQRILHSLCSML